jgi:hypothetical protein
MPKHPPGSTFHALTAAVEKALADDARFTITAPMRLRDKDTGRLREHDIVVIFEHGHHRVLTAIECRDRSRKVDVPALEAFHTKCARTGIHRGVVVSHRGFTTTALAKAAQLGLGCMSLEAATNFDWCLMRHVTQHNRFITKIEPLVTTDPPFPGKVHVFDSQGRRIDEARLHAMAVACLNSTTAVENWQPGVYQHNFYQNDPDLVAHAPDGTSLRIARIDLAVEYTISESTSPVELHSYTDAHTAEQAASVASAPMDFGQMDGRLLFVKGPDGRISVSLQVLKKENPS